MLAGVLREKEDTFYLTYQELHEVVRTNQVDDQLIRRRKAAFRSYQALTPPRVLTSDGEVITGRYRRDDVPAGALVGLPVSAGTIEGRARVILDMAQGDLTGYEYQVPIFVLTHQAPEKAAKGENERLAFTFVTDGIESAIEKARAAAGDKDVTVIGGANTAQQIIRAGLADELHIGIVPVLFGEGLRFFDNLGAEQTELERIRVLESPTRTDILFRVVQ